MSFHEHAGGTHMPKGGGSAGEETPETENQQATRAACRKACWNQEDLLLLERV